MNYTELNRGWSMIMETRSTIYSQLEPYRLSGYETKQTHIDTNSMKYTTSIIKKKKELIQCLSPL